MAERPPFAELKLTSPRLGSPDNPYYADTIAWVQDFLNRRALGKYMAEPVEVDGVFGAETAYELAAYLYRMGRPGPELPAVGVSGLSVLWGLDNGQPLPEAWRNTRLIRLPGWSGAAFRVGAGIAKRTWRRLHPGSYPEPADNLQDGLDVALDWAGKGLRESPAGSNKVPYLIDVAHDLGVAANIAAMGYAWCAFNFFLAHLKAGNAVAYQALVKVSFWPLYCPTLDNYARAGVNGLKLTNDPKPGDGVLFNWDGGVEDHIGMFVRFDGGNVVTCDGNSSVFGSQSNGGMCVVRSRPRSQAVTYFTLTA